MQTNAKASSRRSRPNSMEDEPAPMRTDIERPKITFKDVGGLEALKDEIRFKIIHPLTHPELYQAYGKPVAVAS